MDEPTNNNIDKSVKRNERLRQAIKSIRKGELILDFFDFHYSSIESYLEEMENINQEIYYIEWCLEEAEKMFLHSPHLFNMPFPDDYGKNYELWEKLMKKELNKRKQTQLKAIEEHEEIKQVKIEKIQWSASLGKLTYLFDSLYENNFLPKAFIYKRDKILSEHFLNEHGKPIAPHTLASTRSKYVKGDGSPKDSAEIDQIIKKVKNFED